DRKDPLRRVGAREIAECACADFFHRDRVTRELGRQRLASRCTSELGRHERTFELEAGCQCFFDQPHALYDGQPAAPARLAALEIAHGRLQITANVCPHAGHRCPKDCACPCFRQGTASELMRIALTIAGSDSGGAAGMQADLKTFHQFGVYGTSAITAVTAQNTLGVSAWQALPAALVAKQVDPLAEDLRPTAIMTGMLGSRDIVDTVAERI